MTLKLYLESQKIHSTGDQRSRIGIELSKLKHDFSYTIEDGWKVKVYDERFLKRTGVSEIIINHLNIAV
jgi:hypothetical protein